MFVFFTCQTFGSSEHIVFVGFMSHRLPSWELNKTVKVAASSHMRSHTGNYVNTRTQASQISIHSSNLNQTRRLRAPGDFWSASDWTEPRCAFC